MNSRSVLFWAKVDKTGPWSGRVPGRCWVWTGAQNRSRSSGKGYGQFWDGTRLVPAHQWALTEAGILIPKGYEPDHLCMTRLCVRLSHLEVVTHQENNRRAEAATGQARTRGRELARLGVLPPAVEFQRRKTRCPAGHPYDLANTRISKQGRRCCRACARDRYHKRGEPRLADELAG